MVPGKRGLEVKPIYTKNRVIGLLGGSFNPAHGGHLHITCYALNALEMDAVWWLVSPKNPLKDEKTLADYDERLTSARAVAAADKRICVSDVEARQGLRFSIDTIRYLKRRYKGTQFVWMMGADNLAQFHRWKKWQQMVTEIPIVVFDRAPYSHRAIRSKTYQRMRRFLLKNNKLAAFGLRYIHLRRDSNSSSALRKTLGKRAFLGHNEGVG